MRVYYAHPINIYGSEQEKRDIKLLESMGFEVENPNSEEHSKGYVDQGMTYFVAVVAGCNALAFRALPDGSIPAGIAEEVATAIDHRRPIIELPCGIKRRTLSIDETRDYLKEVGFR